MLTRSHLPQAPSTSPIHLTLSSPPLHLTFSPLSQRLSRIEVRGPDPDAWVSYRGKRLRPSSAAAAGDYGGGRGDEDEDVVKTVRRALGPTYGSSSARARGEGREGAEEVLSYPGVAFGVVRAGSGASSLSLSLSFAVGARSSSSLTYPMRARRVDHEPHRRHGAAGTRRRPRRPGVAPPSPARLARRRSGRPARRRDPRASPLSSRYLAPPTRPRSSSDPPDTCSAQLDPSRRPTHVELHFHEPQRALAPVELRIGETTSEDVLCELGAAVRTFWKEDVRRPLSLGCARASTAWGRDADLAADARARRTASRSTRRRSALGRPPTQLSSVRPLPSRPSPPR